jgi:hypothetical protein
VVLFVSLFVFVACLFVCLLISLPVKRSKKERGGAKGEMHLEMKSRERRSKKVKETFGLFLSEFFVAGSNFANKHVNGT